MKNIPLTSVVFCFVILLLQHNYTHAQQTISYPLESNFTAASGNHPALIPLANNNGQTGNFQTTASPQNFCPNGGDITAYHFEENAGLAFDNSNNFLGCEYTIELLFKFDNLPGLFDAPWVVILGFHPNEDSGLFFEFNPLFGTSFDVWDENYNPHAPAYTEFNIDDWQKLTIVRNCNGIVNFYWECILFSTYNDAVNQILLPGNQLVFFKDNANTLAAEALPGFVRNIRLSNFAMVPSEITTCCTNLCDDLNGSCQSETYLTLASCDINEVGTDSIFYETADCDSLVITTTTFLPSDSTFLSETTCKLALVGITVEELTNTTGCDSIVITNTTLIEPPVFEYEWITCYAEESGIDSIFYDCDSIVVNNTFLLVIDTLFFPPIAVPGGTPIVVFGNNITQPGLYCQTNTSMEGCDSTVCQQVDWLVSTSEPILNNDLYIPNAFSPNGDGINDFFTIYGSPNGQEVSLLQVFNHQGQLLFERQQFAPNEASAGWDGTFRGEEMPSGVYLFLMVETVGEKDGKRVGSFTLIR